MTLSVQWLTMGVMLLSGLGMGIVFDGYRVLSNELRFPRWWLPVLDILYWMTAAVVVFRMLYASNNGEVRAYVFLGLAIGVLIYHWFMSKTVIRSVRWMIRAAQALIRFVLKVFHIIVVKPILLLYKIAIVSLGFGTAITIYLMKIVIQLLRPIYILLWWMLRPMIKPLWRLLKPYWSKLQLRAGIGRLKAAAVNKWKHWLRRD
ncbi:spore cortex biosynthesis protein YabQ [Paenibacillus sp. HB172176]|uniref:spore cortex biosynthesis protein YabQ n=1 Tax=Paenibacillus sp. HB172176 TaxID=2493690 RepID=UPI001F0E6122|nr:spore cortex biosynthesis protein YabQ [Paenibacillus sp. HB172176]